LKKGILFIKRSFSSFIILLKKLVECGVKGLYGLFILIFSIKRTDLRNRCPILIVYGQIDQKAD